MSKAKVTDTVKVTCTLEIKNREIFDSSLKENLLSLLLGQGQLNPSFEKGNW